eukprot:TRINITY_DN25605_c0_g1_i1.p1 TRINITY_DN25605_c0_g1~~TRINITY_DN25605_c0_g1_i1.p1  ORF type:complete len:179 (-),score=48.66 TRINITY_DN25605_c0_g1_i1:145-681(-)
MPGGSPTSFRVVLKEPPGLDTSIKNELPKYEMVPKDGVVIGFVMTLWLYSMYLMFKAWRKILNFSEDQLQRPEKASVLWKWVMELILHNRQGGRKKDDSLSVSQTHESIGLPLDLPTNLCEEPFEDPHGHIATPQGRPSASSSSFQESSIALMEPPPRAIDAHSIDIEIESEHFSTAI